MAWCNVLDVNFGFEDSVYAIHDDVSGGKKRDVLLVELKIVDDVRSNVANIVLPCERIHRNQCVNSRRHFKNVANNVLQN